MAGLADVPERINFPKEEQRVLEFWERVKAFESSVNRNKALPPYSFYDGPPFATGLPHHGHLLAGTIKDVVTRYFHQKGHHVIRRFGWDCHGLPIEYEIDNELGITSRSQVVEMGLRTYNDKCRSIVMRYSTEWETIIQRLGRWIDFRNDYKTMDITFMESVWWGFKEMFDKKLIYRGFKVMPYSTKCKTPLSNFEANLNYQNVSDPEVYVTFPLEETPDVKLVAWTTTPWTLPSNLCLCVNGDLDYVKLRVKKSGREEVFIMGRDRISALFNENEYVEEASFKGQDLMGKAYIPLFDYFLEEKRNGAFRIMSDSYVTNDSGTMVVHCAPAFGEEDFRLCKENGILMGGGENVPCPVDADGCFTESVSDFKGIYVKDADKMILQRLKERGRVLKHGSIVHSYPFCWRSDTPLIYKAVPSWFVSVVQIKDKLKENNSEEASTWIPAFVQKRFQNWLEGARDWAVSRNRFWGTPLPIWMSEDGEERICVGSVAELEKLTGKKVTDLHRESVDDLEIISPKSGKALRRVEEVLDCWFESGCMPFAQVHYPFENKELFEEGGGYFPANFIAEGLDQTRGWFYTLLVVGTVLFGTAPFKNVIVNGLVLAADGKKMSKRKKNYTDPVKIVDTNGADALRLYLINSPAVRAEPLRFLDGGVRDVVRDVLLPWYNAYRFFVQNAKCFPTFQRDVERALHSSNVMDRWILSSLNSLIEFVNHEMTKYRLYTVVPRLLQFIEDLTNWYVRFNRRRLKGKEGDEEMRTSLSALFEVLYTMTVAMAPFTPFLAEHIHMNLCKVLPTDEQLDSVHYRSFPEVRRDAQHADIERRVSRLQAVILLGRVVRDRKKISLKTPVKEVIVIHRDQEYLEDVQTLQSYVREELNTKKVSFTTDEKQYATLRAEPVQKVLGPRLGRNLGRVTQLIKELDHDKLSTYSETGELNLGDVTLFSRQRRPDLFKDRQGNELDAEITGDLRLFREFKGDLKAHYDAEGNGHVIVVVDTRQDESILQEAQAREVINRVQKLRKKAGIQPVDEVECFYESETGADRFEELLKGQAELLSTNLGFQLLPLSKKPDYCITIFEDTEEVAQCKFKLCLVRAGLAFSPSALLLLAGENTEHVAGIQNALLARDYVAVRSDLRRHGHCTVTVNDWTGDVVLDRDVFLSVGEWLRAGGV